MMLYPFKDVKGNVLNEFLQKFGDVIQDRHLEKTVSNIVHKMDTAMTHFQHFLRELKETNITLHL